MSTAPADQPAPFQTVPVATIAGAHAIHDTYSAFLPPLLPLFIERLSLTNAQAGLLTVFLQGPSLLQPFIGHLADQVNLRLLVILAPTITAAAMSLLALAPSYALITALLLVAGVSSATIHSVAPVMAGVLSGANLGRGMGFWMVGGELGRTLGPLIIVSALGGLGTGGLPWLMIGGLLTSLVLWYGLRDMSVRPARMSDSLPWRGALLKMRPFLVPLTGVILVRSFLAAALTTYLPTFLSAEGANLWLAGAALSLLEAAGVVGALTGGALSDRLGRRRVLFFSLLSTPLLTFVFLAVGGWARLPLLVLLGFTSLSITPVIMALVQESYPENRALANGVYMAVSFLLRSGVVVLVGLMGDFFGLRWAFLISAIIGLVGCPVVLLLPERQG